MRSRVRKLEKKLSPSVRSQKTRNNDENFNNVSGRWKSANAFAPKRHKIHKHPGDSWYKQRQQQRQRHKHFNSIKVSWLCGGRSVLQIHFMVIGVTRDWIWSLNGLNSNEKILDDSMWPRMNRNKLSANEWALNRRKVGNKYINSEVGQNLLCWRAEEEISTKFWTKTLKKKISKQRKLAAQEKNEKSRN